MKLAKEKRRHLPNGHTTSNPRRFDVDITLIRRRPNLDKFPRHFHVLFRCNFARRKIHVVSTYSCNFPGPKFHDVSTYFFCTLFLLTFLDAVLMGKNSASLLVSCKLMKTFEEVFPVFVTLISWLLQDCSL